MAVNRHRCTFCSYIGTKEELVAHTEENHMDMIPKGYTPARVVFNGIYKKEHGVCVVCKRNSPWNEKTWKYDRLCGSPACKQALRERYKQNMLRVHNTTNWLEDERHQEEMLAHRSISGKYKFQDGGVRTYTGSYEKKALEFFDKVLEIKSDDIITPGPVLEYEYEGQTHKWITDILYVPANLIIEVKDGGNNPNTRPMQSYREKQIAKEKMITDLGTYNYLRLTNNNFEQLLLILAELKQQMIDDTVENKKVIININEEVGGIPASTPFEDSDNVYIIPYGYNNIFTDDVEGYAFTTSLHSDNILCAEEESAIVSQPRSFLDNRKYSIYIKECNDAEKFKKIYNDFKSGKIVSKNYFYELLSGKKSLNISEEIDCDSEFKKLSKENSITDIECSTIKFIAEQMQRKNYCLPVLDDGSYKELNDKIKKYTNTTIMQDINGFFVMNDDNGYRTKSYNKVEDIPVNEVSVLSSIVKEPISDKTVVKESKVYGYDTYTECCRIAKAIGSSEEPSIVENDCYKIYTEQPIRISQLKELGYTDIERPRNSQEIVPFKCKRYVDDGYYKFDYDYTRNWNNVILSFHTNDADPTDDGFWS